MTIFLGILFVANSGFGTDFERYSWVQTLHDVTITIPVNTSLRSRNVDCRIEPSHLYVYLRGEESPLLNVIIVWNLSCSG